MKKFISGILCGMFVFFSAEVEAQNVWTQHNDLGRTGWYPYETTLNLSNVNQNTFGINFTQVVDEKIVAQPLVIMNVNIPGKGQKNVVFVATQNNSVYAFDADVNTPAYWQANFTNSVKAGGPACNGCRPANVNDMHPSLCAGTYSDFDPNAPMGIIGTPVIDTTNGIIFFVTKIVNPNDGFIDNHPYNPTLIPADEYNYTTTGFHQYLHAVDIKTGTERANSPVEIMPQGTGTGDGQTSFNSGIITFNPRTQFNRPALALNNGTVYIAFAAHCDMNPSHGWIVSYDANSLTQKNSFMTTPNDGRGGIWMSGVGPAIDASGNIYFSNGNDLNESASTNGENVIPVDPTQPANRGESVVKLAPDLTLSDYFTPWDQQFKNTNDLDFGTQVMLLPNTNLVLAQCKDDSIYTLNRSSMGHYNKGKNYNLNLSAVYVGSTNAEAHSTLGYFGGSTPYVYQFSENTYLQQYTINPTAGLNLFKTNVTLPVPIVASGGFLSTSSNGTDPSSAILWVYEPIYNCNACNGTLYAVDANDVTHQLWNSDLVPADNITGYNKFVCPTIARGNVYLAANKNQLLVYSTKPNANCTTNQALGKNATALTNNSNANNVTDGNAATSWTGLPQDVDSIYVDLGGSYDVCKVIINWDATGFGKDFDLKVSNDGVKWTTIKSVLGNTLTTTEYDGVVTCRFVSMVGITRGTANGYSINEFQIFGNVSISCPALTGLTASSGSNISIFTTQIPKGVPGQDAPLELGTKFRSAVPGFITGIRFYKTTGYSGIHVGQLYSYPGGALLGQATFTGETASGWQTATFATPVAIAANTTYIASYYNTSGWYVSDQYGLGAAISNLGLTGLADATDGPNGVYAYSATPTYPNLSFRASNYWVDPVFSTNIPADPHSQLLSWDAFPGAVQYIINYRPDLSQSWITRTTTTNGVIASALSCNTLYDFKVQSDCGNGQLSIVSQGSFTPTGCVGPTCGALPGSYFNVDLGDIGQAGSTCLNGTVYTLTGSGTDIGGNADQFQFAYTTSTDINDYQVIGRIIQQDAAPATNKIGVMIRDSLTNTSRFAYLASLNQANSLIFEYRDVAGGPVTSVSLNGHFSLPYWVQVRKSGTKFYAFISPDNTNWTQVAGPVDLHFGNTSSNPPHYGMAVTSANNALLASGQIDNFSVTASAPLIDELIAFDAQNINNDHVLVTWTTSMEHLVDHYEVERSGDASTFETIQKVKAAGDSEILHNYSYADYTPLAGVSYYRLKTVDQNGNYNYSQIVSVNFDTKNGLEIYPNPAGSFTSINSRKYPILEVHLYDVTGKLLQDIHLSSGLTKYSLNTADLAQGMYFIRVTTTTAIYQQKLLKQ